MNISHHEEKEGLSFIYIFKTSIFFNGGLNLKITSNNATK